MVLRGSQIADHGLARVPSRSQCLGSIPPTVSRNAATCAFHLGIGAFWQGSGGTQVGDIVLTNRGSARCMLRDTFSIQILSRRVKILPVSVVTRHATADRPVSLVPGASAQIPLQWTNWCGGKTSFLLLRLHFPGSSGYLATDVRYGSAANPRPAGTPPCLNSSAPSKLYVGTPKELS